MNICYLCVDDLWDAIKAFIPRAKQKECAQSIVSKFDEMASIETSDLYAIAYPEGDDEFGNEYVIKGRSKKPDYDSLARKKWRDE